MAAKLVFVVDWLVVVAVLVRVVLRQCVAVDAEYLGIDVELVVGTRVGMPSVVLRVLKLVVADELVVVVDWLVVAAVPMEVVVGSLAGGRPSVVLKVVELLVANELVVVMDWLVVAAVPLEVVVNCVVVGAVPVVDPSVWVRSVLADVVDWVVMAVVPVEAEVIVREEMVVVDVPPVGVPLPLVGVRLWAVVLLVMGDVIMVGLWVVIETGSVVVLMDSVLPDALVVVAAGSVVDTFTDVVSVVWPDTVNVGKKMPNKRKCRATV